MERWQAAGVVTALILSIAPAIAPADAGATSDRGVNARLLDNAQRFREEFGFRNEAAFVKSTFTDARKSSEVWGVPLSGIELADLDARLRVRDAFDAVLERALEAPGYAGAMIDQKRGGLPIIFATEKQAVDRAVADISAIAPPFEVRVVSNSEEQLQRAKAEVLANLRSLQEAGLDVVSVGLDIPANKVAVGMTNVSDAARSLLLSRFGSVVVAREDEASENDACTDMAHCWPLKGGLKIYVTGYSTSKICTSGFMGRRTDNAALVMITAGHCLALNGIPDAPDTWGHMTSSSAANNWGTELYNTWFDFTYADVGAITLNANALSALTGSVTLSHWRDAPIQNYNVSSGKTSATQIKGDPVCRMGWGTWKATGEGRTCGAVGSNIDVTRKSCESGLTINCRWIDHTWEVTFDSIPGDSGGPITRIITTPTTSLQAYGTHVHSGSGSGAVGWYSPWQWGKLAFDNLGFNWTIHYCFTTTSPPCTT